MKILCVQNNYNGGVASDSGSPLFFIKPDSALLQRGQPFFYPDFSSEMDCELNLVIRINRLGKNIQSKFAHKYYNEVALGLNFTARDIHRKCVAGGLPWTLATSFDNSAAISDFVALDTVGNDINNLNFELLKNGTVVNRANISDMNISPDEIIAYLSQFMTLKIGDYIFMSAVGITSIAINDCFEGMLNNNLLFKCRIK